MFTDSFEKIFGNRSRVMAVFAHPDDAQLYCGGTIVRLTKAKKQVRVVKMTSGNRGSRDEKISSTDLAKLRMTEDHESLNVLGIKNEDDVYLHINDGEIENDLVTIGKIARQIRLFKPDVIITHNPQDMIITFDKNNNWVNHRDHRNTGKSAIDAAYPYSRDTLFFPEHFKENGVTSHKVVEFLLVDYYSHPDLIYIDVADFVDIRTKALACHASQYSLQHAQDSTDFFTKLSDGSRAERFRYVIAD